MTLVFDSLYKHPVDTDVKTVHTFVEPAIEEGVVAGGAHGEHVGDEEGDVEILPTV